MNHPSVAALKQILLDVEQRMDPDNYGMYKEYRKEVWVRFRDFINESREND